MKDKNKRDNVARALAIKAQQKAEELNNTTKADLIARIETLEGQISTLSSLQSNFDALSNRMLNYETHTHNYVDDNGTTQDTKTTEGVN